MSSFAQMQTEAYFWLGTDSRNKAFPAERIKRALNIAKNDLVNDCIRCNPDAFTVERTLATDPAGSRIYPFASQSPAINNLMMLVQVCLNDADGDELTESTFGERNLRRGYLYSLVGPNNAPTLHTNNAVRADIPLYVAYVPSVADMVADSDTVTVIPEEFHDVLTLVAAELASGSGNEQAFSQTLAVRLMDRRAQLLQAVTYRSVTPTTKRIR